MEACSSSGCLHVFDWIGRGVDNGASVLDWLKLVGFRMGVVFEFSG